MHKTFNIEFTNHGDKSKDERIFFSIDPSIRACGWAKFHYNGITAGLCRSKEKDPGQAALEIFRALQMFCPSDVDHLVVERPIIQENWTRTKVGAITKLIACYGMCLTLASVQTKLWTPSVPEWKGQLSKEISHSRATYALRKNGIRVKIYGKVPKSLMHNTLDAIALLTRYLQNEGMIE